MYFRKLSNVLLINFNSNNEVPYISVSPFWFTFGCGCVSAYFLVESYLHFFLSLKCDFDALKTQKIHTKKQTWNDRTNSPRWTRCDKVKRRQQKKQTVLLSFLVVSFSFFLDSISFRKFAHKIRISLIALSYARTLTHIYFQASFKNWAEQKNMGKQ